MATENEHIRNLLETRASLVESRRGSAKIKDGIKVRQIQENIDAVDRALNDERALANPPKTETVAARY
jgi:hypothetical protein